MTWLKLCSLSQKCHFLVSTFENASGSLPNELPLSLSISYLAPLYSTQLDWFGEVEEPTTRLKESCLELPTVRHTLPKMSAVPIVLSAQAPPSVGRQNLCLYNECAENYLFQGAS